MNTARPRQSHNTPVVARPALSPRLPAIHPLAVGVVLAGNELRRLGIQHALAVGEEVVAAIQRHGAQARVGKVHVAAHEVGRVGIGRG